MLYTGTMERLLLALVNALPVDKLVVCQDNGSAGGHHLEEGDLTLAREHGQVSQASAVGVQAAFLPLPDILQWAPALQETHLSVHCDPVFLLDRLHTVCILHRRLDGHHDSRAKTTQSEIL